MAYVYILHLNSTWEAKQMSAHLPVNAAAQCPVSIYKEVDCCKQQHHGNWVVEQT